MKCKKIMEKSIFIFIFLLLIIPNISASITDIYYNYDSFEKTESIKPDDQKEIITFIEGSCHSIVFNKRGIIRDVIFYSGSGGTNIYIKG